MALVGPCSTVLSLPHVSQGLKDLFAFAGMAGENFAAWEGNEGQCLAASCWLLCGLVICAAEMLLLLRNLFELQHVGV